MAQQDKPPAISFNLDSLERENAPGPFVVVVGGRPVEFLDAQEVDFRDLLALMTDPMRFFDVALSEQDREHVKETKVPAWKLNKLFDAYREHFGMPDVGNAAASSPS